jgi:hypothetical protein
MIITFDIIILAMLTISSNAVRYDLNYILLDNIRTPNNLIIYFVFILAMIWIFMSMHVICYNFINHLFECIYDTPVDNYKLDIYNNQDDMETFKMGFFNTKNKSYQLFKKFIWPF